VTDSKGDKCSVDHDWLLQRQYAFCNDCGTKLLKNCICLNDITKQIVNVPCNWKFCRFCGHQFDS